MKTDTEKALGAAIRARRRARNMTLAELGRAAGIDVSQLSKIERGRSRTSVDAYDRIAAALEWAPASMWRSATTRHAA
jgi:transcriptional regulator with XRE-family HTH domain